MKKSTTIIGIVIIILVAALVYIFTRPSTTTVVMPGNTSIDTQATTTATTATTTSEITYTASDVALHHSASDCWMIINGSVYNVTSFIPNHPGGSVITQGCGIDATSLFESRPGSGTPHSGRANAMLKTYYIGKLAQ